MLRAIQMTDSLRQIITKLKDQNLFRVLKKVENDQGTTLVVDGKTYLNFSSNNYLGLANHPELIKASVDATQKFGTSSGASRLITGSMSLHHELEETIARFKGCEAALVFNSGYHANIGVIPTLTDKEDYIFSDELNHASLIDACRLSHATTQVYRHNDLNHLEELLQKSPATNHTKLIITDSVFSMDGDLAPLPQMMALAEKYHATVFVDEAHGTGVFGKTGRGVVEHFRIDSNHPRLIQMGTLGKALGSFGAYVCGSSELKEFLINKSRAFIYTTALPPGVIAASIAAFKVVGQNPELRKNLWGHVDYFKTELQKIIKGSEFYLAPSESPIIPLVVGDTSQTMKISNLLFEAGVWAHPIRPPTVPEGTSRIRFTLMATHTPTQLDDCLGMLKLVL